LNFAVIHLAISFRVLSLECFFTLLVADNLDYLAPADLSIFDETALTDLSCISDHSFNINSSPPAFFLGLLVGFTRQDYSISVFSDFHSFSLPLVELLVLGKQGVGSLQVDFHGVLVDDIFG